MNETKDNLISPCNCKGSMKYVHKKCLIEFIHKTDNEKFKHSCYVCNYIYHLQEKNCLYYIYIFLGVISFMFYMTIFVYFFYNLLVLLFM